MVIAKAQRSTQKYGEFREFRKEIVCCDLSKSFDTVSHVTLRQKLYHYGVHGLAYTLMKSNLSKEQQIVSWRDLTFADAKSAATTVPLSVSQGSMLGPTLFGVLR